MNSFLEKTQSTVHLPQWYSSFRKASQRRSLSPDHNQRANHVFVHPSMLVLHPLDAQVDHPMNSKTMSGAFILVFGCHCPPPPSWRHAYRRPALNPRLAWKSSMHACMHLLTRLHYTFVGFWNHLQLDIAEEMMCVCNFSQPNQWTHRSNICDQYGKIHIFLFINVTLPSLGNMWRLCTVKALLRPSQWIDIKIS